jgi:hypothetical protein
LNYGADATDAKWRSEHDTANSKFILAENLDGGTVLLEYDETAGEFVSRGPVNMDGNDISNAGSIDAQSLNTDLANINDYSATLEKTTDQSISSGADVTVDWDNQTLDTNIYTFNIASDTLDVLEDGDYRVNAHARLIGGSDQDLMQIKVFVNGNLKKIWEVKSSGTQGSPSGSAILKGLSANDTIRIDVRDNNSNATLDGIASLGYVDVTKEA